MTHLTTDVKKFEAIFLECVRKDCKGQKRQLYIKEI